MLLTQCLPSLVVAHNLPPSSGNLRGTNKGFGIIDKLEYLQVVSQAAEFKKCRMSSYPEAEFVWQCLKRILFQPGADNLVQKAQSMIIAFIYQQSQPIFFCRDIQSSKCVSCVLQDWILDIIQGEVPRGRGSLMWGWTGCRCRG